MNYQERICRKEVQEGLHDLPQELDHQRGYQILLDDNDCLMAWLKGLEGLLEYRIRICLQHFLLLSKYALCMLSKKQDILSSLDYSHLKQLGCWMTENHFVPVCHFVD